MRKFPKFALKYLKSSIAFSTMHVFVLLLSISTVFSFTGFSSVRAVQSLVNAGGSSSSLGAVSDF
jgi:hypothetical protein